MLCGDFLHLLFYFYNLIPAKLYQRGNLKSIVEIKKILSSTPGGIRTNGLLIRSQTFYLFLEEMVDRFRANEIQDVILTEATEALDQLKKRLAEIR